MKRINKNNLTLILKEKYSDKRKTVDIKKLIADFSKICEEKEQEKNIKNWIDNHYKKNDFQKWFEKQKDGKSIRVKIKINIIEKIFFNMEIGKIEFLASFLKQDKKTKAVNFDIDKLKHY